MASNRLEITPSLFMSLGNTPTSCTGRAMEVGGEEQENRSHQARLGDNTQDSP